VEDMESFARLVTALRPWLGQLVVVGGWAHRLHRFHRLATPPDHLPLRTRDTDRPSPPRWRWLAMSAHQRACAYGLGEVLGGIPTR